MKNRMIRADFAISRDKEQVRKVGHSTISVPEIRYTGKGMKWLDESQYRRTDNNRGEDNNEENDVELSFIRSSYLNNSNTYIGALDSNGEYWTDVSINLYKLNRSDHIFISDLCNIEIIQALETQGLIIPSGRFECIGLSYFPEYILSDILVV